MKKVFTLGLTAAGLFVATAQTQAQKIGYVSLGEVIQSMPEAKKADTALVQFREALYQAAEDKRNQLEKDIAAFNTDSSKYTPAVKEVKRSQLQQQLQALQGEDQRIQQEMQRKQDELSAPIQKKAMDAVQAVAKESGYAYVLAKEAIISGPPGDDILALVKKKLGLK